jgi:hypothetical protein
MEMKKLVIVILMFCVTPALIRADEGMWLPVLLEKLNEKDMQKSGLKLKAEDIYSVNKSSLKDAVVHFGGGCTGEIISNEGMLLTNHHCGFSQIQSHSTVEKDYIANGFWAMTRAEELPCPGLTVTFIIRMEDVTAKALAGVKDEMSEKTRDSIIQLNIKKVEAEAVKGTHYTARTAPFYNGNEYYMFITEVFKDVRMVGAPPSSIGNFGGDTDNWMWPRHTGDFSIFRVYAGKDNKPAEYSKDNVPFKPRHFLPVSLKGVKENDFAMVYGFPGRTTEYLSSHAVDLTMNVSDPAKVAIREVRLEAWRTGMMKSQAIKIQYASKYAGVSNYHKKWKGEMTGLRQYNAVQKKQEFEKTFRERVAASPEFSKKYGTLLDDLARVYKNLEPYQLSYDYFTEAAIGPEIIRYANGFKRLVDMARKEGTPKEQIEKLASDHKNGAPKYFKDYHAPTDEKVTGALLQIYYDNVDPAMHPPVFRAIADQYGNDFRKYAAELFSKSLFASQESITAMMEGFDKAKAEQLAADPAYQLMENLYSFYSSNILPGFTKYHNEAAYLNRLYMRAQREVITEKKYYPDANSTLRVTYGKVKGYSPREAVTYDYFTTVAGIMEKADSTEPDFRVPAKLVELYNKKDFGQYADHTGLVPTCFIATCHTTGGNSGSPVIDGNGYLIGTNFDRNWEGTMADIMYDPSRVRNIICDIRYTLFVIDKVAGAGHLIREMKIVK